LKNYFGGDGTDSNMYYYYYYYYYYYSWIYFTKGRNRGMDKEKTWLGWIPVPNGLREMREVPPNYSWIANQRKVG